MKEKICSWCNNLINSPTDPRRFSESATGMKEGEQIYYAIMDKKLRSIDLCNYDYMLLKYYRHSQNQVIKCRGDLELFYGECVMEDIYKNQ